MSSQKNTGWYQRVRQFLPFTQAKGEDVAAELDAIQASLEKIPTVRDDGTGFAKAFVIPEPTKDNHPVTLGLLKNAENSVLKNRETVEQKAQEVSQNARNVAQLAQQASNAATNASLSNQSATTSATQAKADEALARKWAVNPVAVAVQSGLYSAYHYAMQASTAAQNAESAKVRSTTAEANAANSANYAAQQAQAAAQSAQQARELVDPPDASTTQRGLVQLSSATNSEAEDQAATPKVIKLLKGLIDSLVRNLANYIPNSKKSDSVSSPSSDTVATSNAAKTAYDKAVVANTKAGEANDNANTRVPIAGDVLITGTKTFFYQLQIKSNEEGVAKSAKLGQNANYTFIQNPYSQRYLKLKNSGELQYQNQNVFVRGLQNPTFADIEQTPTTLGGYGIADWLVKQEGNTTDVRNLTVDGVYAFANAGPNLPTNSAYKLLNLAGSNKHWRHQLAFKAYSTDFYIRSQASSGGEFLPWERIPLAKEANLKSEHYATVTAHSAGWGGLMIESATENMLIQKSGTKLVFLRRNKVTSSNIWAVDLQEKSGTLALLEDLKNYIGKNNIAILTGEVAHGGTIPLPSGFTQTQCKWFVSPKKYASNVALTAFECSANENRVVTLTANGVPSTHRANYLIIGVK